MKRAILAAAAILGASANAAPMEPTTALVGATIVDGNGGPAVADGVVILRGDRIVTVGKRGDVAIPKAARIVDVSGKWLTPGLIDAHVHFSQSGGLYTRPDAIDLTKAVPYLDDLNRSKGRLDETFARYLASGVTTVVDAGGPMWIFDVRAKARASSRAPRVAIAGPLIATEPTPEAAKFGTTDPVIVSAASVADARRLAIAQLKHRPDFIKIWGIGSGAAGAARVRDMTRAVADVAHPAGVRVAVHATELAIAQAALDGGADMLVHSVEDSRIDDAFIRKLKERNVVYVTTAVVHEGYEDAFSGSPNLLPVERKLGAPDIIASLYEMPARVIERAGAGWPASPLANMFANAQTLVKAGARVAAGTDAGNIGTLHGPAIHREFQLLARAGLTPAQILTAATRDAAFAYSPKPDIGLIAPGYRADLLLLDADPLKDSANLSRIATVWSRGNPLDPATLLPASPESIVQEQLERYNAHDLEGFVATYADDVEIFDLPLTSKTSIAGKPELRKIYGGLFKQYAALNCRSAQRMVQGNFVIDQEVCIIREDKPPFGTAAIYQVENGKIRRVWFAESAAAN